uniref:26S proteasome non-ATPase regulatory subunit 3 n=1 Tax=Syphacia muris TaxID=451379 RepID=A0A0N5AIL3_9BILA
MRLLFKENHLILVLMMSSIEYFGVFVEANKLLSDIRGNYDCLDLCIRSQVGLCKNLPLLTGFKIFHRILYKRKHYHRLYCLLAVKVKEPMYYDESERICSTYFNGHLLSIANEAEKEFIDGEQQLFFENLEKLGSTDRYGLISIILGIAPGKNYFFDGTDAANIRAKTMILKEISWSNGSCVAITKYKNVPG